MEKISIFNYEAFYLDYLEGNLSEEEGALLLAFLEEHPELKLEETELPQLKIDSIELADDFKSDLKYISFNEEKINHSNAEQFLIAESEGLLNPEKEEELTKFIGTNSELQRTRRIYASSHLKPNLNIQYENKDVLKRARRIVLWPYVAMAAAASVAILLYVFQGPDQSINIKNRQNTFAGLDSTVKEQSNDEVKKFTSNENSIENKSHFTKNEERKVPGRLENKKREFTLANSVDPIQVKSADKLDLKQNDLEIIENVLAQHSYETRYENEPDYTILGFQDMNNPIEPVTSKISDIVKQDVDFRTAKATDKNSGGFYLKIGKLEVSHKKH